MFRPSWRWVDLGVNSFADWLGILVETENEVIRTIYDDDVLYDELNLG